MNLLDWIKGQILINKKRKLHNSLDILVQENENGTTLSLNKFIANSGTQDIPQEVVPCIITGKDGSFYEVDLYGNGYGETSTGKGRLLIVDSNLSDTYTTGSKIIGFTSVLEVLGDEEDD